MTKRLGLFLSTSLARRILCLVVAMFLLSTDRWISLPISDAIAAESHLARQFGGWDNFFEPCISAIESTENLYRPRGPIPKPGPLVIGCKLADCGPGTDGPGPIDLRITLTGNLAEKAIFEFENMTVSDAARIGVRGNAGHVKGTTKFEVRSGITVLRGFGTTPKLRPPVAIPHLTLNREALEVFKQAAEGDDLLANSKSSVTFDIEQFRGRVNVNRYAVRYEFRLCPRPRPPLPPDRVEFSNGIPPDKVLVLAPGHVGTGPLGCGNYEEEVYPSSATATVPVNNHLEDKADLVVLGAMARHDATAPQIILNRCHSEVVVYGKSNALAVVQPVTPPWTNPRGDKVPVALLPPLNVPVTLWILYDPDGEAEADVRGEIPLATTAFLDNAECGIKFPEPWVIHKIGRDISFPHGSDPENDFWILDPGDAVTRLRVDAPFYTAGTLNVYIIKDAVGDAGVTVYATNNIACSDPRVPGCDEYGDMILISYDIEKNTTLAHEIGHTLSLEHVNGVFDDTNNLMWAGNDVATRLDVTKGQCYRAHVDHSSYLNTGSSHNNNDGVRALLGLPTLRDCPRDGYSSAKCPDLSFDFDLQ